MEFIGKELTSLDLLPPDAFSEQLNLSFNKLRSLAPGPSMKETHRVEELIVQHNRLSSFDGVGSFISLRCLDVGHNSIRTIDERAVENLAAAKVLSELRCSNNNIGDVAFTRNLPFLRMLDLSDNALTEIPTLSICKSLHTVDLSNNSISSLVGIESAMPNALRDLRLAGNVIPTWHSLSSLTAFGETLHAVAVEGNPFCHQAPFSWRCFVAWLLPVIENIDGAPLTPAEMIVVSRLFRQNNNAKSEVSLEIVGLMNDGRESQLERYLIGFCQDKPLPTVVPSGGDVAVSGEQNLHALSAKVKKLAEVVRVLRQQDMKIRKSAAVVIQSAFRGFCCRRKISRAARDRLLAAHKRALRGPSSIAAATNDQNQNEESLVKISQLETVVKRMWEESSSVRRVVLRILHRSACRIQSHFRGYLTRRRYASLREEYLRFAAKFVPGVVLLQSVGRALRMRKRVALAHSQRQTKICLDQMKKQIEQLTTVITALRGTAAGTASFVDLLHQSSSEMPRASAQGAIDVPPAPTALSKTTASSSASAPFDEHREEEHPLDGASVPNKEIQGFSDEIRNE